MILDFKSIDSVTEIDIEDLIKHQVPEGKRLDYKQELPRDEAEDKMEFLKDVSSFANASGGFLVYGIEEENGYPIKIVPLQNSNPDDEILRLNHIILNGIDPRIHGIEIREIKLEKLGYLIIVKIPDSLYSPHMVKFRNHSRFYSRVSRGRYQLDVQELRDAFMESATLFERAKEFRKLRVDGISFGETSASLASGTKVVLHIIPLSSFSVGTSIDLKGIEKNREYLQPFGTKGCAYRYNFDGYLAFDMFPDPSSTASISYTQVFRNGCIESVKSLWFWLEENPSTLPALDIEIWVLQAIDDYLEFYRNLVISPPFVISMSVLGVEGYEITTKRIGKDIPSIAITRESPYQLSNDITFDNLLLPEVILDEYDANIDSRMKVPFDTLWNSAGWSRSYGYDEEGKRTS